MFLCLLVGIRKFQDHIRPRLHNSCRITAQLIESNVSTARSFTAEVIRGLFTTDLSVTECGRLLVYSNTQLHSTECTVLRLLTPVSCSEQTCDELLLISEQLGLLINIQTFILDSLGVFDTRYSPLPSFSETQVNHTHPYETM
jgi:hypothetical protein